MKTPAFLRVLSRITTTFLFHKHHETASDSVDSLNEKRRQHEEEKSLITRFLLHFSVVIQRDATLIFGVGKDESKSPYS